MPRPFPDPLSRRERQIMDVLYARGAASVAQVREALPDPPSYSAVRALCGILVDKGHLKRRPQRGRYVYSPIHARAQAGRSALLRVVQTFYQGSLEKAVTALLTAADARLPDEELARLQDMIDRSRSAGHDPRN